MDAPTQINVYAARTHLSQLLHRAEQGEEFVIARDGVPVARLVPLKPKEPTTLPPRVPGTMRSEFTIPPEFFEPMSEEELAEWYRPFDKDFH